MDDATDQVTSSIQTLFRLNGSRRIHQQQAAAAGVSMSQQALRVLERTLESRLPGGAGSTTPGQLASWLELDPAAVTRLLRQLEDAGLVRRRRSDSDGRVSTIEATDEGRDAFERVRAVIWSQVRRALSDWPEADIDDLATLLGRLVTDVQREPYQRLEATAPITRP